MGYEVEIHNRFVALKSQIHINELLTREELLSHLIVINVGEGEIALILDDGNLIEVLGTGRHLYWGSVKSRVFQKIDISNYEISFELNENFLHSPLLKNYLIEFIVQSFHYGLLVVNGKFIRRLESGRYRFWGTKNNVYVYTQERRLQNLEISGQELMTEDKITLRLNVSLQFQITNPEKTFLEIQNLNEQLHVLAQLVLRDFVSGWKLDTLLEKREEASKIILEKMKIRESDFGVCFQSTGIKDVILPGEMKDILNTVLLAEKKAQANLITRREETASTRSLLNTAKILDENPTLLKLKEWEHLEKIADRIQSLHLSGNQNMLLQLEKLFLEKK